MILITGATGNIGSELVRLLVAAGEKVRVLARDPKKAGKLGSGVEVVQGDLDHAETLGPALRGVDKGLLLAGGFNVPQEDANFIDEARKAGVKHVVMVSSMGVELGNVAGGAMHVAGEERLRSSGMAWTILRPSEFMSNFLMFRDSIKGQGAVYLPTGSGKHALIHPHDIAAVAAKVLTTPGHEGKTYALTGGEAISTADCAARLSAAIGKAVKHVDMPDSAYREQLAKFGMPAPMVDAVARFYAMYRAGQAAAVLSTIEQLTSRKPRTFDDWARENAAAFA